MYEQTEQYAQAYAQQAPQPPYMMRGSEAQDYLRCGFRWYLRWGLNLQAKKPNNKLFFGNLFHKWVEVWHIKKDYDAAMEAAKQLWKEANTEGMEEVEKKELWTLLEGVTKHYVQTFSEVDKQWRVLATEFTFAIPLTEAIYYTGTIDMLYLDEQGRLCFMDHKTTDTITKYEKNAEMDRQISRYWWALQMLSSGQGYILDKSNGTEQWVHVTTSGFLNAIGSQQPHGFVYNIVKKTVPEPPKKVKVVKSNPLGISVAKDQHTTYDMYMDAIKAGMAEKNLTEVPQEYVEILDVLKTREARYFKRIEVVRLQSEINAAINEFYKVAMRVQEVRNGIVFYEGQSGLDYFNGNPNIYRNITNDCHWDCEFKALCVAEMGGHNINMIASVGYEQRGTVSNTEDRAIEDVSGEAV